MQTLNCAVCGKPMEVAVTGTPTVYHWDCANEALREVREDLHKKFNKDKSSATDPL